MKKMPFRTGATVIRTTETNPGNTGILKGYTEDGKYAYVHWSDATEPNKTTMHKTGNLCTRDERRAIQSRQATLRNAWAEKARAR